MVVLSGLVWELKKVSMHFEHDLEEDWETLIEMGVTDGGFHRTRQADC